MQNVLTNLTSGGNNAESNELNKLTRTVCYLGRGKINLQLIANSLRDEGRGLIYSVEQETDSSIQNAVYRPTGDI